jgi:DNA-binding response OmpR family regulator
MTIAYSLLLEASTGGEETPVWRPYAEERSELEESVAPGRLLVVDDEPIVRTLVSRILMEQGHTVQVATNGAQALELAASDPIGFDLVITDIRMPGMDGWQLGRQLSERWPALRLLYMSGLDIDDMGASRELLIRKPFEHEELVRRVRELLR